MNEEKENWMDKYLPYEDVSIEFKSIGIPLVGVILFGIAFIAWIILLVILI
jgi:hypothetical protein